MFRTYNLEFFGKKIKSIRINAELAQIDVYEKTGISTDTLRRLENGMSIPRYDTLKILSEFYKVNLITVLDYNSFETDLLNYYDRLEQFIDHHDLDKLKNLIEDFNLYRQNFIEKDVLIKNEKELIQFELLLDGFRYLYCEDTDVKSNAKSCFINSLQVTIPAFKLNDYRKYKYDFFELKILLFLSISLSETDNFDTSNALLDFILQEIKNDPCISNNWNILIVKVYLNLAYNAHRLSNHDDVIQYANLGIQFCKENYLLYSLFQLYYRLGIAQFLSGKMGYRSSLNKAIQLLKIQDSDHLLDYYVQNTYSEYNIDISNNEI